MTGRQWLGIGVALIAGIIIGVQLAAPLSDAQTWRDWQPYFDGESDAFLGPPEERLVREDYVQELEDILDPMIEEYAASLPPKYREDFLKGQVLVQVQSNGRTAIVDILGNINHKFKYRDFIRSVKQTRYPKFPRKMDDGMIQFRHTLDKRKRRRKIYVRYYLGNWYFSN